MTSRTSRIARALIAALEDRIPLLVKKYPGMSGAMIRDMASIDPTGPKASYLEWMVRRAKDGDIRWPEDRARTHMALTSYVSLKRSPRLLQQYQVNPDINKYTLHDLEDIHDMVSGQGIKTQRQTQTEAKQNGARVLMDDGPYQIIQIGGDGVDPVEASQAACLYAKGTKWCTSDPEVASKYLEKSPLYVILKDREKVAQFDPTTGQLMDIRDRHIWWRDQPGIFSTLFNSPIPDLGNMIESIMTYNQYSQDINLAPNPVRDAEILRKKNPLLLVDYCISIRKARWPEAEFIFLESPDEASVQYTEALIGERWPELEDALLSRLREARPSIRMFGDTDKPDLNTCTDYAVKVIKGPWPAYEKTILHLISQWVKLGHSFSLYSREIGDYVHRVSPSFAKNLVKYGIIL